jgi:hypothetical protein
LLHAFSPASKKSVFFETDETKVHPFFSKISISFSLEWVSKLQVIHIFLEKYFPQDISSLKVKLIFSSRFFTSILLFSFVKNSKIFLAVHSQTSFRESISSSRK